MAKDDVPYSAYTLRFKHGKHTILLFADPLTPFSEIKYDLLTVLREQYPDGLPRSDSDTPLKIPESILDVILGVPNDPYDNTKGWSELDTTPGGGITESPKSLGVKDGGVIAFVFVDNEGDPDATPEFNVEFNTVHHSAIEQAPDGEDDTLKGSFGYVKGVDKFPGEVEGQGEERHATAADLETGIGYWEVVILLISPINEILLLHRVQTSRSFAAAHVFPGGNLSASQDGKIPAPDDKRRHVDGPAYRLGAIRECFEESGILLAKKTDESDGLLEVSEEEREKARKEIHSGKLRFEDWVKSIGGVVDLDSLIPFTRWITPPNLPRRFSTQMYIYFLPLTSTSKSNITSKAMIPVPTSDGGVEHTAALFASCVHWLDLATRNKIILFPPQYYLMHLLSPFLLPSVSNSPLSTSDLQGQRNAVLSFLGSDGDSKCVKWADKVMSPVGLLMRKSDGRSVLALDKPGPELEGSGRGGDEKRVVLVKFSKEGPRNVEVRLRKEILDDERNGAKL
ncbi:hypothetical protein G7Y89_g13525 [Cudoniella acicularis]|uniref:Nudix hydrolase domain-containing protein n=1 Tax=Cudoniella acicularis TaxID=354080 RepID=A0A8H4VY58_9HELO|nr:hypothetical protein G7Y89_g13525 [Cudoniella acicularis]